MREWTAVINVRPMPIQSATFNGFGGVYHTKKKKAYMDQLKGMVAERRPTERISGPVTLEVTFVFPFRAKDKKHVGDLMWHTETPDRGNLLKGFEDAIKESVINDDSFIVDGQVRKVRVRGCTEGAIVCTVRQLPELTLASAGPFSDYWSKLVKDVQII